MKPSAVVHPAIARCVVLALGLLGAWTTAGCSERRGPDRHVVLSGTVESLRADTGQLTVRITRRQPQGDDQRVLFLLTNDTEVYINDMFSSFDAIEIGDTVELIAYRDPNPRAERFVVSLAHITRNEPLPPAPDLSPPTTEPTTQPQES